MDTGKLTKKAVPYINVTPLIDVLLVLLIIFMVVTPMKPSRFKALIPEPPSRETNPLMVGDVLTLVVTIKHDGALELNKLGDMGSVDDTGKLSAKLMEVFRLRLENWMYKRDMHDRIDLPFENRIPRTVFIKAPKSIAYGEVAKVIDSIKGAGAEPVGLQIDELD